MQHFLGGKGSKICQICQWVILENCQRLMDGTCISIARGKKAKSSKPELWNCHVCHTKVCLTFRTWDSNPQNGILFSLQLGVSSSSPRPFFQRSALKLLHYPERGHFTGLFWHCHHLALNLEHITVRKFQTLIYIKLNQHFKKASSNPTKSSYLPI